MELIYFNTCFLRHKTDDLDPRLLKIDTEGFTVEII